jgi:hypothetical protein
MSDIANASKLAIEILAVCLKIKSYAGSLLIYLVDGGRDVKKSEIIESKNTMMILDLIMLRVRSGPNTSVIISLMEYIIGRTNIAVLALSLKLPIDKMGKVLLPMSSETIVQKTYNAIRKSSF